MMDADIELRVVEQRLRDRRHEMMVCRMAEAARPASLSRFDIAGRLQALAGQFRPRASTAGTASAAS